MADPGDKKRRATYQDVLDAPHYMVAELIDGELRLSRPGVPATSVATMLTFGLAPFGGRGGPGGWIILIEPEIHFGDDVLIPDLAGWRVERLPLAPDEAFLTLAPDWICEVLSPSTERSDRVEKMPRYAQVGVGHAWLVHPRRRTLEVFRLHDGKWLTIAVHKDDDRARIEPFEAIELELAALWTHLPLPTKAGEEAAEYAY